MILNTNSGVCMERNSVSITGIDEAINRVRKSKT